MSLLVQTGMVVALFVVGVIMILAGLFIILAREYHQTLKLLSSQSARLSAKALTDEAIQPILEGSSRLLDSVTQMIRTAVGTGAFLCLLGTTICGLSFWMSTTI